MYLVPTFFNTCKDLVLNWAVNQSICGTFIGNINVTDHNFADDAVIFAETLDVLVLALKTLSM